MKDEILEIAKRLNNFIEAGIEDRRGRKASAAYQNERIMEAIDMFIKDAKGEVDKCENEELLHYTRLQAEASLKNLLELKDYIKNCIL